MSLLISYTAYKFMQLLPQNRILGMLLTIPLFLLMMVWQFIYRTETGIFESGWFRIFAWAGSLTMGVWATFIIFSMPLDLVQVVNYVYSKFTNSDYSPARRAFISNGLPYLTLVVSTAFASVGLFQTLRGPRVKKVSGVFPNLTSSLEGLKIAQISDLHVGPTIRKSYVEAVVKQTNDTNPDLIFVTGDLVDAKALSLTDHLAPLANLKSKFGTYYVTGNHEYYWDAPALLNTLENFGLLPLINENKIISVGDSKLMIAGVTDPTGDRLSKEHAPDMKKAVLTSEKTDFKILLAHRPDACFEAEPEGFDLQFSGHTHAGQFFPFNIFVRFAHKYYRGLNQHNRMQVYVNSGTGYWGPANRFGVDSEITLMTLNKQIEI